MTNEERLKAAGWHVNGAKCVTSRAWTKDRIDFYTESEALVVVITAERDAAIARAEAAEALAASRPEITPEDIVAYTDWREGVNLSTSGPGYVRVTSALRAHAAKVSR